MKFFTILLLNFVLIIGQAAAENIWDGNNPFHQPYATTDYYGSGDTNNDGTITEQDVDLAQEMVNGTRPASTRADVNGNGEVDAEDVILIDNARRGETLPAWWNSLTNRTDRNNWVTKFLSLDKTNSHPFSYCFFQCINFATQLFIHGAYYGGDLFNSYYDGGQTVFNIPIYYAYVGSRTYGHGINAILVGDNPLNFSDWRFIEPQTDNDVSPGMWNMPYDTTVSIKIPSLIGRSGAAFVDKVVFTVTASGGTLSSYAHEVLLSRPTPTSLSPNNLPDLWNPHVIRGGVLFERYREDMSRTTDIHFSELPFSDSSESFPLTGFSSYTHLLDAVDGKDGLVHLLWSGKDDDIPGVFYGLFDPDTREVTDVERVSAPETRAVRMGRLIVTDTDEIHAFWFTQNSSSFCSYDTGIYWSRKDENSWQTERNLTPGMGSRSWDWSGGNWEKRDLTRYFFDASLMNDGNVVLVWAESEGYDSSITLRELMYDGSWGSQSDIETTNASGVKLLTDANGILHMVYWTGGQALGDGWGNLMHRTSADGTTWSDPETVDAGGESGDPWMTNYNQTIYLVWERNDGTQVVPVWNAYTEGSWGTPQPIDIQPDSDAWYPVVNAVSNGIEIAWSSHSSDRASIETFLIQPNNGDHSGDIEEVEEIDGDLDGDGDVDKDDQTILKDSFRSRAGDFNFMSEADYDHDGRITFIDYRKWYQYYQDYINQ